MIVVCKDIFRNDTQNTSSLKYVYHLMYITDILHNITYHTFHSSHSYKDLILSVHKTIRRSGIDEVIASIV